MLSYLDVLQVYTPGAAVPGHRAVRFAAGIAADLGARLFVQGEPPLEHSHGFYARKETLLVEDAAEWMSTGSSAGRARIVLVSGDDSNAAFWSELGASCVFVQLAVWHSEDTLFTVSGLAELLGEPDRGPLVPLANYATHTVGYAAFCAMVAVATRVRRFGENDVALVDGVGAITWTNWKTLNVTETTGEPLRRQGNACMWPVLECNDGGFAFLFRPQDWPGIVEMIGDAALEREEYGSAQGLMANRDEIMEVIGTWCRAQSIEHITREFENRGIPGAPLVRVSGLFSDALLVHRNAFKSDGPRRLPVLPHRIISEIAAGKPARRLSPDGKLPLSGIRVLDLGIIGAGAGTAALLADLGADVIKIESPSRPDPFRSDGIVPGSGDRDAAPLFKSKNRNKRAVALDLKTEEGLRLFYELARSADIVLENFRRGVIERLGVTFDRLREANACIVLASISGQGNDGPGVGHATFGSTLEANGGMGALSRYDDGSSYLSGPNLNYPDQIVNLLGAAVIAACVTDSRERGVAVHIDIAQRDCAIYQIGDVLGFVSGGGGEDVESLRRAIGRPALSGVFACSDGRYVAVSSSDESLADRIDGLYSSASSEFKVWASGRRSETVINSVLAAGGAAVRSSDGHDLLASPDLFGTEVFVRTPDGTMVQGFPFQLRGEPLRIRYNSPLIGEHTVQVLKDLL